MSSRVAWLVAFSLLCGTAGLRVRPGQMRFASAQVPVTCSEPSGYMAFPELTCSPTPAAMQVCANNVVLVSTAYCPGTSVSVPHDCPGPYTLSEHYGSQPPYVPCGTTQECADGGWAAAAIGCPEGSTASINIQVKVVNANGQPVGGAQLAGNSFTLTGQAGGPPATGQTDGTGSLTFALVGRTHMC